MDLLWVLSVSMLTVCVAIPMDTAAGSHSLFTCEPITLRMCQGLSYNSTFMPNVLNHYDQQTAALAMEVQYTHTKCLLFGFWCFTPENNSIHSMQIFCLQIVGRYFAPLISTVILFERKIGRQHLFTCCQTKRPFWNTFKPEWRSLKQRIR